MQVGQVQQPAHKTSVSIVLVVSKRPASHNPGNKITEVLMRM